MIYVTGDCHSVFSRFFLENFPEQIPMTKDDFVIICGDFGGVWDYRGENEREKYWLDWLDSQVWTTLFIDGNHENFTRLYQYPVERFHGGRVHKIRPSVLHLMRGEIFSLCGKKIFTFGGASCHDIRDGVLDPVVDKKKIKAWSKMDDKMFRVKGVSWWEEELPCEDEYNNALINLEKNNNKVDFVITHCAPQQIASLLSYYETDGLTKWFNTIAETVSYDKWFFGHYHDNVQIMSKFILLYEQIIRIA